MEMTFLDAIRRGLWEEMERDDTICILGQDVAEFGGPFKITKGFLERFGAGRVINTPISESAMVGMAVGAAMFGLRPIVEIQYIDFICPAFNQIVNMAAKNRWRWGVGAPIVIRGPAGPGSRAGPFHSATPEMWFAHAPGIKVVVPATPSDARGLLKAAIRDPDPVLFLEHKLLYRRIKEDVPEGDGVVPLGKARVVRPGSEMTLVTYGQSLHRALEALEQVDVDVELIDLRTIVPLDMPTVLESVRKTSRLVVLHDDVRTGGLAGELAMRVIEEGFESLDAPIVRITSQDTPAPQAPTLEDAFMPQVADIVQAVERLAAY